MEKYIDFDKWHRKMLKDPEFKKAYDDLEPEFAVIRAIIEKRIKDGLTQKQLAKKIGIKQPIISRLESGTYNPSLKFLKKIAKALDAKLVVTLK